ncbi:hypothetical protein GURASL_26880 [Geotalea uraniireducens]|uniref:Helix-turn-helix type 11 domain-containing protein n=1 Tax=Geotalea uraniireducens TaxID=351604 RepID=A0ABN6VTU6_9BACT|nr:HTH domain-containing protein [Geotalea uraniireducens]BDV43765.1 hypothetical protein GURASL_26880 [Geotalea uraniireducens]
MNKLDVALNLLQLLNERERLNSRLIAAELNVSLRTAQRYLLELSRLPCVIFDENDHSYRLNADYRLKSAITTNGNSHHEANQQPLQQTFNGRQPLNYYYCAVCGHKRKDFLAIPSLLARAGNHKNPQQAISQLAKIIRDRLSAKKCSFP